MDVSAVGSGAPTSALAPPQPSHSPDPNSPAAAAGAAGSAPAAPHMSGDVMVRSDGSVDGAATIDHYRQAINSAWSATTHSPVVQHALAATSSDPATRAAGLNGLTHDASQAYSSVSSAVKSGVSAVSDAAKDAVNVTDPAARARTAQRASAVGHAAANIATAVAKPVAEDAVALGKTVAHASQHAGSSWADIPVAGMAAASNFVPETKGAGVAAKAVESAEHVAGTAIEHAASATTHIAGEATQAVVTHAETAGIDAANRAQHEGYVDSLRAAMQKPVVSDPHLASLVDDLYRKDAKVGSGSTAAAVRQELQTGEPVGGSFHSQKAENYTKSLQKWLDKNPTASPGDRAAAENIIRDMQNALNGK